MKSFKPLNPINKPLMQCYPEVADDENEKLMADVRRHWLGRVGIIVSGGLILILLLFVAISMQSLAHGIGVTLSSSFKALMALLIMVVMAFVAVGSLIALWVYNQSRMLITDQNVIELRQMSLFSHKIAHLNMINVEDVSVTKRGILQTFFDYGTLSIETAGEQDNFSFPSTPNPDDYRRMVINCHEQAIERVGNMGTVPRVLVTDNNL